MADNTVTLVGNVTRDPELRFIPSGQAVAQFGLAVNRRWQNRQSNEWEEQTSFFDVKCWAQMAENVSESIQRGARVIVTGRLEQRSWETEQGDKRSKVEVVADEVEMTTRPRPDFDGKHTVEIKKNERREGGGAGGSGPNRDVDLRGARAGAPTGGGGYDGSDEEPF